MIVLSAIILFVLKTGDKSRDENETSHNSFETFYEGYDMGKDIGYNEGYVEGLKGELQPEQYRKKCVYPNATDEFSKGYETGYEIGYGDGIHDGRNECMRSGDCAYEYDKERSKETAEFKEEKSEEVAGLEDEYDSRHVVCCYDYKNDGSGEYKIVDEYHEYLDDNLETVRVNICEEYLYGQIVEKLFCEWVDFEGARECEDMFFNFNRKCAARSAD